ncbi:MAG: FtsW/RodA/SpoVE family cell cycle protein [Defluviitaleaceae bacterium]|nr:FtsW/RodA/SpoVE family cell cycle protein [Defluviitaleaceae bacterium]
MEIITILKRKLISFDYLMLILVLGLSIFGVVVIGSATRVAHGGNPLAFENQQLWVASGVVLLLLAAFIDYKFIARFYIIAYVVNIGLLLAVQQFGHVMVTTGVVRAVDVIDGVGIQPSEFSKILMILFLAVLVERLGDKLNKPLYLAGILASIALPVFLVAIQPSLSAAMVVLIVSLAILFAGGVSFKYIIPGIIVMVPAGYMFLLDILREEPRLEQLGILQDYQIARIIPLVQPERATADSIRQTMQSIRAIGSGQLHGQGLHEGTLNQLNYVAHSHNDFIFAVIGEELGYIGGITVLAVVFIIVIKCLYISFKAESMTGKLIAAGVGFMMAFQTFVNVGVAIGILPNTGMVLPFISYGGSSMWVNMAAIGLVINVSMEQPKKSAFSLFEE